MGWRFSGCSVSFRLDLMVLMHSLPKNNVLWYSSVQPLLQVSFPRVVQYGLGLTNFKKALALATCHPTQCNAIVIPIAILMKSTVDDDHFGVLFRGNFLSGIDAGRCQKGHHRRYVSCFCIGEYITQTQLLNRFRVCGKKVFSLLGYV
jgi:hypothetical protein